MSLIYIDIFEKFGRFFGKKSIFGMPKSLPKPAKKNEKYVRNQIHNVPNFLPKMVSRLVTFGSSLSIGESCQNNPAKFLPKV